MKKYDVIIIGSGLSGLSCGYYLTKKGKKVLILEKQSVVGGRTASWKEKEMDVESGLHRMLGFYEELPTLMEACDIKLDDAFIWEDQLEIHIPQNDSATFGMSLFKPVKTVISSLGNNDFINPLEKAALVKFLLQGFADLKKQKKKMDTSTLAAYAKEKGLSDKIIFRILTPLTEGLFFIPPEKYSAYNFFALFAPYLTKIHKTRIGAFSGGMTEVMTGPIAKKIQEMGSHISTNALVEKIIIEENIVKGIIAKKETHYADTIVIATGLKDAGKILRTSTQKFNPFAEIETMPSVTMQFLLSERSLAHDRMTFSPGTLFASYSEQSKTTFRDTQGRLSVIIAQAEKYVKEKEQKIVDDLLEDAKKLKINLNRKSIIAYKIVTWAHDFYSYAPGNAVKVPDFTTPIKGLYLAGDYTNQKYLQTMEGAVTSGKIVAKLIS